ncbi:MAG: hypothetical protein BV457_05385, partial [Thermoplasmata archaeon M9B1D]
MTQQIPYEILKKIEEIEIRRYPKVLFAVVQNDNNDSGFSLLFRYISGENKTRKKIPMTAPVITSEKITMTAPVITGKNYMAFALPPSYNNETVPIPTNPAVKIEIQKEKTMAVLQFSGRTNETKVQNKIQKLITTLKTHETQIKGEP